MPAHEAPPSWPALIWIAFVIAASLIYRRAAGKPVLFFTLRSASFLERTASGHSNDNFLRRLGGARNCLVVGVVADRLIVRPFFPFNLVFLPEIYGLEHEIAIKDVVRAELGRSFWQKSLVVTYRNQSAETRSLTLYLKDPERLAQLLRPGGAQDGA